MVKPIEQVNATTSDGLFVRSGLGRGILPFGLIKYFRLLKGTFIALAKDFKKYFKRGGIK